jgi:outer membrane murein-binding lipoprotein Lpp
MATGPWQLTGNAGTDPSSNFLGTTDGESLSIKAAEISLDLTNGGGQLHVTNNPGDNRIWMEAFNNAGNGSATELLLTGQDGQNVPVLSLFADQLSVRSKELIFSLQPAGGGRLRIACNPDDNKVWLEAFDANADGSATEFLLTGALGSNVPQMTFNATNATFSNNLVVSGNLSGPTINQIASAIENLHASINQLQLEINQLAASTAA